MMHIHKPNRWQSPCLINIRHYQKPNYAVSAISFKSHMNTIKLSNSYRYAPVYRLNEVEGQSVVYKLAISTGPARAE